MMLLFVVVVAIPVFMLVREWLRRRSLRKHLQRGFEVKLTTGQTPVIREKENDHG
jgi:preprotein translocase subunit YajC